MRYLLLICAIMFSIVWVSCSCDKECQSCTNTNQDWTICDNEDGTITRTNNVVDTAFTATASYAESIAFFESQGLDCKK